MTDWDLVTRENWQLILTDRRIVEKTPPVVPKAEYSYTPIPPIYAAPNSPILLIGVRSDMALSHWFLGARVSQYLYIEPNLSSGFSTSGVQASDIKSIGLNRLVLVEFKKYNIFPYVLKIEIPYWLEDIHLVVWEYIGIYQDEDEKYQNIIDRLDGIEDLLYSGSSGSGGQ